MVFLLYKRYICWGTAYTSMWEEGLTAARGQQHVAQNEHESTEGDR